jgi:predicted nucleic acid-binding protein
LVLSFRSIDALIAVVAQIRGATLVHRNEHMRATPVELLRQQDLGTSPAA